jgi:transposase InsO family protein
MIVEAREAQPALRIKQVLGWLGIRRSAWYTRPVLDPKRPGRKPKPIGPELASAIRTLTERCLWWGYRRIALRTLVTDNGSSFLARRFQSHIDGQYRHVCIQYRSAQQLGLLERFHETLKHEEIDWQLYEGPQHARESLAAFQARYNEVRPHWALIPQTGGDPVTPADVYLGGVKVALPKWQGWAKAAKAKLEQMLHDEDVSRAA